MTQSYKLSRRLNDPDVTTAALYRPPWPTMRLRPVASGGASGIRMCDHCNRYPLKRAQNDTRRGKNGDEKETQNWDCRRGRHEAPATRPISSAKGGKQNMGEEGRLQVGRSARGAPYPTLNKQKGMKTRRLDRPRNSRRTCIVIGRVSNKRRTQT